MLKGGIYANPGQFDGFGFMISFATLSTACLLFPYLSLISLKDGAASLSVGEWQEPHPYFLNKNFPLSAKETFDIRSINKIEILFENFMTEENQGAVNPPIFRITCVKAWIVLMRLIHRLS